jgi:hypothetical protein
MASQSQPPEDVQWLIEPAATGDLKFHIAIGEGVEVTPEIRQAIERLMTALQGTDTQGYAASPSCIPDLSCGPYSSGCRPRQNCMPLTQHPCAAEVSCRIKVVPMAR